MAGGFPVIRVGPRGVDRVDVVREAGGALRFVVDGDVAVLGVHQVADDAVDLGIEARHVLGGTRRLGDAAQRRLRPLVLHALRDVHEEPLHVQGPARVVEDVHRRVADPDDATVRVEDAVLHRDRAQRALSLDLFSDDPVAVVVVEYPLPQAVVLPVLDRIAEELFGLRAQIERLAGHRPIGFVAVRRRSCRRVDVGDERQLLRKATKARLGLLERGDVPVDGVEAAVVAVDVERHHRDLDVDE